MDLIGLGTWKSEPGDVGKAVREAIRIGYRHIDCASFYGNEAEVGLALREAMREGEVTRKDLWITSKLWCNAHGKKNVGPAIKKSLSDFGLDYLDMYMVHWPVALKPSAVFPGAATDFASTAEAPMQDTWGAMEAAHAEGLTRHLGVSNFSAKKVEDLLAHAKVKPEVNQIELHPFLQQTALVDYCTSQGIHVTGYSPLGSGDRPEFLKAVTDPVPLENSVIKSIAGAHKCTPAQVLLAWHVQRGILDAPEVDQPGPPPRELRSDRAAAHAGRPRADRRPRPRLPLHRGRLLGDPGLAVDAREPLGRAAQGLRARSARARGMGAASDRKYPNAGKERAEVLEIVNVSSEDDIAAQSRARHDEGINRRCALHVSESLAGQAGNGLAQRLDMDGLANRVANVCSSPPPFAEDRRGYRDGHSSFA